MIKEAVNKIVAHHDLTFEESKSILNEIMSGKTSDAETASLLTALAFKEPTINEIAGAATAMREHALAFPKVENVLEIVGTGGDKAGTFNISTTSALVAAATGTKVVKHGNRAASSKSGAADVLEALGLDIQEQPAVSYQSLQANNLAFLFAQEYHKSMKYVAPVRKQLGFRTLFNLLGPLVNPARPAYQLLGVYDEQLLEPLANVLKKMGVATAMVVHGRDGLDELTTAAETAVVELKEHKLTKYTITPAQFGLKQCSAADLLGGDPNENAQITRAVLQGQKGPKRDVVLLNTGAALHLAHPALSIQAGIELAAKTIDSGAALAELNKLIEFSRQNQSSQDVIA
ncbi:anthranilate phosphoribosyltransferase [Liquorilactobacillus satsumensis]|uniref:Anthranilate phosphoribosyltransferase n=1 Tax=Liquorilactobacillus satsumensis DSM 16230 = JCM 12392 TaxID=1423801 RepID=A0A0R1UVB1_9LACO|nr:anthranilate phosphoribosyltransferase [Liquorilactobacillus satsumensis]KRL97119.1 anthranilate phosphoribosyltransferase [Liquorilactobacillus satsumensis DSM 16230 = JCM 12392]MCC7666783.1 anthranilate phosphoribosyltransferase [Liquorilactobacillus satsumensis]MCP9311982.1 anthranilate phosphoribosyltransferase [Liquorilactobacillus satsumensis]MCP9328544.1 anthranilate phosphoribosyltransferase [Liquorilactobacillus satsumensis]MCP9358285.1 anthranilate phosphoribosyltransferase [Liquo